jgi:hypothetical protein
MDALSLNKKHFTGHDNADFLWADLFKNEDADVDCLTKTLQCTRDENSAATFLTPINSRDCFLSEICRNKSYAATLHAAANSHSSASGRMEDSREKIHRNTLYTVNLTLAILILFRSLKNILV